MSSLGSPPNPYVGPRPLETGERLFGRERELTELCHLLSAERIVLLHSPSGAGKSSLVQAGLIPRLRARFDVWRPTRVGHPLPDGSPADTNRYVLSPILGFEQGIPERVRRTSAQLAPLTLAQYVAQRPRRPAASENILLIFDQFEEILTADPLAVALKHEFFAQLGELLQDPRVWALFLLREEYIAQLDPYVERVPTHLRNRYRINLLDLDAAAAAIGQSAEDYPRKWTQAAIENMVHDLAQVKLQQPDGSFRQQRGLHVEPMQLQVACRGLWNNMPADDLSIDPEDVARFGNVTQALSTYYAGELARIADDNERKERALREWVGEKLITAEAIRCPVLLTAEASEGLANDLIQQLLDSHLVRADQRGGATWFELAHDRLIEPVQSSNQAWFAQKLSVLQKQAKLWSSLGRPEGLLLRGQILRDAEAWAELHRESLAAAEAVFLAYSIQARTERLRQTRANQRVRILLAVAILSAVAMASLGAVTYQNSRESRSLALAAQSKSSRDRGDGYLATIAAVAALQRAYTPEAERALAEATGYELKRIDSRNQTGHQGGVWSAHFSPDGSRAVTSFEDGTARILLTQSGEELCTIRGHLVAGMTAVFSPDGHRVATSSEYDTVGIWDAKSCQALHTLSGSFAAFSPDGERIVTLGDKGPMLWDARLGQLIYKFDDSSRGSNKYVAFSPDGTQFRMGYNVWDTRSGQFLQTPSGRVGTWYSAGHAFSPDGQRLLIVESGLPISVSIIDAHSGKRTIVLSTKGPERYEPNASFSPNGELVLINDDPHGVFGTIDILNSRSGKILFTVKTAGEEPCAAAFSSTGERVISYSRGVYIWDVASGQELASITRPDGMRPRVASLSGDRLLIGYPNGEVELWQMWPNLAALLSAAARTCGTCEPTSERERLKLRLDTDLDLYRQYQKQHVRPLGLALIYLVCGWCIRRAALARKTLIRNPKAYLIAAGSFGNVVSFLGFAALDLLYLSWGTFDSWERWLELAIWLPTLSLSGVAYAHLTRLAWLPPTRRGRVQVGARSWIAPLGLLELILTGWVLRDYVIHRIGDDRLALLLAFCTAVFVLCVLNALGAAAYIYLLEPWVARYHARHKDDD